MALFPHFPYSNMHELNLDWIIETIEEFKETVLDNAVLSVNGQTGEVILYQDHNVDFPDVNNANWRLMRSTNGQLLGVQFDQNYMYFIKNGVLKQVYTSDNQPPYPVTSVNGTTGDVVLAIPFAAPLTDSLWMATEASSDQFAGMSRETIHGNVSAYLESSATGVEAYISFISTDEQTHYTRRLLTLDDIPSSSGVVSLNGQTGVVTIYGDSMPIESGSAVTIKSYIDTSVSNIMTALNTTNTAVVGNTNKINSLSGCVAFTENTDNATYNIPAGAFVNWKGNAYTANQAISLGDGLSLTNLDAVPAGGITNALNSKFNNYTPVKKIIKDSSTTHTFTVPSSSYHLVIAAALGQRMYCGIINTQSSGTVTIIDMGKGSVVTASSSGNNNLTITFSSAANMVLFDYVLIGGEIT